MWRSSALRLTVSKFRYCLLPVKRYINTKKPAPKPNVEKFDPVDMLERFMRGSLEIVGLKKVGGMDREKLQKKRFAVFVLFLILFVAVWEENSKPGKW